MRDMDKDGEDSPQNNGSPAGKGNATSRSRSRSRSSSKSSKKSGNRDSYSRSRSRSRYRSDSDEDDLDGYRLHIADIGDSVRKSDLEKIFTKFGALKEIWMTNSSPCFGFAVYKEKKAATEALNETDGIEIGGCRIRVSYAKPRTKGSGRRFFNPNMRCYQCGYTGHFYRDCPEAGSGGGYKRSGGYDSYYDRGGYDRGNRRRGDRDYDRDYGGARRHYSTSSSSSRRRRDDYGASSRSSSRRQRY